MTLLPAARTVSKSFGVFLFLLISRTLQFTIQNSSTQQVRNQRVISDFQPLFAGCTSAPSSRFPDPPPPPYPYPPCVRGGIKAVRAASLSVLRGPRPPVSDREAMLSCRLLSGSSGGESVHCLPLCSGLSVCPFVRVSSRMATEAALRIRHRHRLPPPLPRPILLLYCPQSRYHPLCRCVLPFAR